MILDKITAHKKIYLEELKKQKPLQTLIAETENFISAIPQNNENQLSFRTALLKKEKMALIAEVKKASPSKGLIREDFDHKVIAQSYANAGVDAMSVLTETEFFLGNPGYLTDICKITHVPLLRKDFIIDEYQIFEARLLGAKAILLIAALLGEKELSNYLNLATKLGLDCLCETHNAEEINLAAAVGAEIIGINNRDLHTFNENLQTTPKLINYMEQTSIQNKIIVSESAIRKSEDLKLLKEAGVNAVLIGELFMRSKVIEQSVQEMSAYL